MIFHKVFLFMKTDVCVSTSSKGIVIQASYVIEQFSCRNGFQLDPGVVNGNIVQILQYQSFPLFSPGNMPEKKKPSSSKEPVKTAVYGSLRSRYKLIMSMRSRQRSLSWAFT